MYIHVKVRAGAKKETFERLSETSFAVGVREKAERNMANRRVAELLARHFSIPAANARIISGHRSASKIFSLSPKPGGLY